VLEEFLFLVATITAFVMWIGLIAVTAILGWVLFQGPFDTIAGMLIGRVAAVSAMALAIFLSSFTMMIFLWRGN